MRVLARALVVLLAGCSTADPVVGDRIRIESFAGPIAPTLEWKLVARVVDALTGSPLPGARLHYLEERSEPPGGVFFYDHTWFADDQGFVRVPAGGAGGGWYVVVSDGHGPAAMMGTFDGVVALMPGIDVPVRVVDWLERPIAGAEVGLCLGCGHTPDVRVATTDGRGEAVLRCIEPTANVTGGSGVRDLYVRAPGIGGPYSSLSWQVGDPPVLLRVLPVPDVRGRVVAPNGMPFARAAIGGSLHRGPWTWTADDGTFVHRGRVEADDELLLRVHGREFWLHPSMLGASLEARLAPATLSPRAQGRLRVCVRDDGNDAPIEGALVQAGKPGLVHPGDPAPAEARGSTDAEGVAVVVAPAGAAEWEVVVEGFETMVTTVDVAGDTEREVLVRLARQPLREVVVHGVHEGLTLETRRGKRRVRDGTQDSGLVSLPAHEPFVLVLHEPTGADRRFVFESLPDGAIVLRVFASTRARLRVVDEQGQLVPARVAIAGAAEFGDESEWHETGADGVVVVPTTLTGRAFLRVEPRAAERRARTLRLVLPPRGDDIEHAVGDVVLAAAPPLRIVDAVGQPVAGTITVMRPGLLVGSLEIAADGGFDALDLQPGDRLICAPRDRWRRVTRQWFGPTTWILPAPGTIHIELVDEHGMQPLGGVAMLGDMAHYEHEGSLLLVEVPAGEVEILVGARGCTSARVTLQVSPGEVRVVRVVLRRE